jgi:hypothetical protein
LDEFAALSTRVVEGARFLSRALSVSGSSAVGFQDSTSS